MMSPGEIFTLTPTTDEKPGIYHSGVTCEGFVSIAGAPHNIADGESITDGRSGLNVKKKAANSVSTERHNTSLHGCLSKKTAGVICARCFY
jgi:hypothetical protein